MNANTRSVRARVARPVLLLTTALLALAAGVDAQSQSRQNAAPAANDFMLDATIAEVMDSMVMSSAQVLWDAVAVDVTADGVIEKVPETDEDWARLRWSAVTLAEAANTLIIPGRRVNAPGVVSADPDAELGPDQIQALLSEQWPAWVAHARVLHQAAMETLRAIDAKDVSGLTDAGGTIDAACESCHLQFWYPETQ